jgi:predicted TIM-barrel fold metal-dependent hydrolase
MTIVVDAHCHVGVGHEYRQSAEDLLRAMDQYQIDRAVICPVDRCIAVDNREGNDLMMATCRAYPNRFYAFATANPWYGQRAVAELRRAIGEGAKGIKLHPALQGFLLCDDLVYPIIELAEALAVPVFFHTGTPAFAQPMQLAELALRFPRVNMIMGHMGTTDLKADAVPAASLAPNIYLDTSWILPGLVTRAVMEIGPERVIFSSDSPLSELPIELELRAAAQMSADARAQLMGGNILRLLGESA